MSVSMSTPTPPAIETPDHGAEPAEATGTPGPLGAQIDAKQAEFEYALANGRYGIASQVLGQMELMQSPNIKSMTANFHEPAPFQVS